MADNMVHPPTPTIIATSQQWTGNGVPANTLGSNGDTYVNKDDGAIYTKSGDAWASQS